MCYGGIETLESQDKTSQWRTSQVERPQHDRSVCECDAMGIVEVIVSENFRLSRTEL